jgi:hypothetical protein
MSRRWDERGTGTATGGRPPLAPGERRRHMTRYGLPKSLPQNHFRRKSYRLSASAEMDTTRHSFGCYGHGAVRHRTPARGSPTRRHGARGRSSPSLWPHGPSAHRRDDCPRLCRRSNIPRSSTLCPERGSGCGSSPSMVLARAFSIPRLRYDLCSRYAVHHGLIAGRYALCRVGLLFPTCVRGCAAQSPLIFKPGN